MNKQLTDQIAKFAALTRGEPATEAEQQEIYRFVMDSGHEVTDELCRKANIRGVENHHPLFLRAEIIKTMTL